MELPSSAKVDKPSCMRQVGGFCIADSSSVWQEVVDSLAISVLAAEGSSWLRRAKAAFLSVLRHPLWRRLIPKKEGAPIAVGSQIDVAFQGRYGKWIAFDLKQDLVIRRIATKELYDREVWIRSLPVVETLSPDIMSWDDESFTYCEQYVRGRPVQLHDLDEGLTVLRNLWPSLGAVYEVKTSKAPLKLPSPRENETLFRVVYRAGLAEAFEKVQGREVKQGLVHGDLKHPNVIVRGDEVYVIDWGEQFFLAPPLFDLLYYLYWHTRSFAPEIVVNRALCNPQWIEDGLPGSLEPAAVKASLCVFAAEMVSRTKEERRQEYHLKKLVSFLEVVATQLEAIS